MDILYQYYLKFLEQSGIDSSFAIISWFVMFFVAAFIALVVVSLVLLFFEKKLVWYFVPKKLIPQERKSYVELAVSLLQHLRHCDLTTTSDNAFLFSFAPAFMFTTVMLMWGLLPYSNKYIPIPSDLSLVLFLALITVYSLALFMSNISSDNRFAYVAAIRSSALSLICLLPLIIVALATAVIPSSLSLNEIILNQSSTGGVLGWYGVSHAIGFLTFIASIVLLSLGLEAEYSLNESENVYGTKYALLMLSKYGFLFAISAVVICLFCGGYLPIAGKYFSDVFQVNYVLDNSFVYLEQIFAFFVKTFLLAFLLIWLRVMCTKVSGKKIIQAVWNVLLPLAVLDFIIMCIIRFIGG